MSISKLAELLRQTRALRSESLKSIADRAGMSAAYLQKLEMGAVQNPSPRRLLGLGRALEVPYVELMRAAGYLGQEEAGSSAPPPNALNVALSTQDVTPEEAEELVQYLAWVRQRRGAGGE